MGAFHNVTHWIYKGAAVLTADSPITTEWWNAEDLNGCQFFLKYTGASNVTIDVQVSPADAYSRRGVSPADAYEEFEALASGANGTEGFFDPPSAMDRPFASYRFVITLDADITACNFALCRHGVGI